MIEFITHIKIITMNKVELNQSLEFLNNPGRDIQIILYACLTNGSIKKWISKQRICLR